MVTPADLKLRLSGGGTNEDPQLSIGGAMSLAPTPRDLMDNVTSSQTVTGLTEYRCVYLYNGSSEPFTSNRIYISQPTPALDSEVYLGLGVAGFDTPETAIPDTDTAPPGVVFSHPDSPATALILPTLAPGSYHGLWVQRIVDAGATAKSDGFSLRWIAETTPLPPVGPVEVIWYFGASYFGGLGLK